MRQILFLFFSFFFITHASSAVEIDSPEYFKSLDYFNPESHDRVLKQEAEYAKVLQNLIANSDSLKAADARTIIYTTLFMTNTNQAITLEQISYTQLIQYLKLDGGNNLRDEMLAREKLILEALVIAQKLTPYDYRLEGWLESHKMFEEYTRLGYLSDETFKRAYDAADRNIFSFAAVVIVGNELTLTAEQEASLLVLGDKLKSGKIPCVTSKPNGSCADSTIAPHTGKIGKIILGDLFLKYSNRGGQDRNTTNAVTAKVTYNLADLSKFTGMSEFRWNKYYKIGKRIDKANSVLFSKEAVDSDYFKSTEYNKVYTCTACHQAKAP